MTSYMGVADAHGIESFIPVNNREAFALLIRAQANRQRHAVFFVAELEEKTIDKVKEELAKKNFVEALKILKKKKVYFPRQIEAERSWKLIPNSELDPYGGD